jgi:hypothetical protein
MGDQAATGEPIPHGFGIVNPPAFVAGGEVFTDEIERGSLGQTSASIVCMSPDLIHVRYKPDLGYGYYLFIDVSSSTVPLPPPAEKPPPVVPEPEPELPEEPEPDPPAEEPQPPPEEDEEMKAATYNYPHRLDRNGTKRKREFTKLANDGVTVIASQENTDADPAKCRPDGWAWHRPKKAASAALYWDSSEWKMLDKGSYKLSRPGNPLAPRYIVWAYLENRRTKRRLRFGSCHLPAFKTSRKLNRAEFIYQEKRAAKWLAGGSLRVLMGDFNAHPGERWMPNMIDVGIWNTPLKATGPKKGQKIDHIWVPKGRPRPRTLYVMKGGSDHKALVCKV